MINLKRAFKRSDLCNITRLSGLKCAKGISKTYQMKITSFKNVEFISFFTLKPGNGSFYPSRVFSIAPVPYSNLSGAFLCMLPTSVRVTVKISDKQSAHLGRSYPCPGSIAMIAFLHASRFCASSGSSWSCLKSLRTLSNHLSLGLPQGLFPPTFIVVPFVQHCVSALLITWLYHERLFWMTTVVIGLTITSLLKLSFLIRSILVLP